MKDLIEIEILKNEIKNKRNNYTVSIQYKNKNFETVFHDSIYNYENGISLNTDDVIYAVLMDSWAYDSCNSIEDFANEFGYELYNEFMVELYDAPLYNPKLLRVYSECHKTSNNIHDMFNDSELQELYTEFENY